MGRYGIEILLFPINEVMKVGSLYRDILLVSCFIIPIFDVLSVRMRAGGALNTRFTRIVCLFALLHSIVKMHISISESIISSCRICLYLLPDPESSTI